MVKNLPANAGDAGNVGLSLGCKASLEEEMATYSNILAWRIPWIEETGRLIHRVTKSQTQLKWLSTCTFIHTYIDTMIWIQIYTFFSGSTNLKSEIQAGFRSSVQVIVWKGPVYYSHDINEAAHLLQNNKQIFESDKNAMKYWHSFSPAVWVVCSVCLNVSEPLILHLWNGGSTKLTLGLFED